MKEDDYKNMKRRYEDSLKNFDVFCQSSYTVGISDEIETIRQYYRAMLYLVEKDKDQ